MQRAIFTAPVARNVTSEPAFVSLGIEIVPGATNGTLQAWSTVNGDDPLITGDPDFVVYATLGAMPKALRKFLIIVRRSDTNVQPYTNIRYVRWADLAATDYVRTWNTGTGTVQNNGPITVKAGNTLLASDRFVRADCDIAHVWFGVDDSSLGDTN